jgi:hypothetical protein
VLAAAAFSLPRAGTLRRGGLVSAAEKAPALARLLRAPAMA